MAWIPLILTLLTTGAAVALGRTRWAARSLLASRIAYTALVLQAPLFFVTTGGFQLSAPACEWTFGPALALHSLTNYKHIILFAIFFLLTFVQLRGMSRRMLWTAVVTMAIGLLVELAQGVSGEHHCRMRDLIPDAAGALAGAFIVWASRALSRAERGD